MPWFKVDDSFHAHPKAIQASNASLGLWVKSGAYSAGFLLDGHIDRVVAERLGRPREIEGLVNVGLWVPNGSGFDFHDWLDYQPSAEQVRRERAQSRARQADLRAKRLANRNGGVSLGESD